MSPGCLGESPSALMWLTLCDLPSASCLLPFLTLNHTSFLGALGTCQTLSCLRAFAYAVSSALKALLSSVLPLFLCPWDDCCCRLVALNPAMAPLCPHPSVCSLLPPHCSLAPSDLDLPNLVPFYLFLLPSSPCPPNSGQASFPICCSSRPHLLQAVAGSPCPWVWDGVHGILFFSGSELA